MSLPNKNMKNKIIAIAKCNILKDEEIIIYLVNGKWRSNQLRFYKTGQRFLLRFVKKSFRKIKGRAKGIIDKLKY